MPFTLITDQGLEETHLYHREASWWKKRVENDGNLNVSWMQIDDDGKALISRYVKVPELHKFIILAARSETHRYPTLFTDDWFRPIQFQDCGPGAAGFSHRPQIVLSADTDLEALSVVCAYLTLEQGRPPKADNLPFAPSATPRFRQHVGIMWQNLASSPDHQGAFKPPRPEISWSSLYPPRPGLFDPRP